MAVQLTPRQRRWLDALLILSTIAVGYVVMGFVGQTFAAFGDIILIFFLAWLLTFILAPPIAWAGRRVPRLPRGVAVLLVYGLVISILLGALLIVANALVNSIAQFADDLPQIRRDLPQILAPWQDRIDEFGLGVELAALADDLLANLNTYLQQLAGPLQQIALASIGIFGNLLFIVIFSVYMAVDRDHLFAALYRLVPPGMEQEARLLQTSVARSFGGFLRGQAAMGAIYTVVAVLTNLVLGLQFLPVTAAAAGLLMAIPFFGPFVAWAPPVLVAVLFQPDAIVPAVLLMGGGWFLVMNVVQPRLMQEAVGLHPIVVLGSVIVGARIAGIPGAIFGIPIAAVLAAFFFHFYRRTREPGTVTERAAQRLEAREGHPVRVPREPQAGIDPDVPEADGPRDPRPVTPAEEPGR
jgi:predicted PurR-regulated permease PerM